MFPKTKKFIQRLKDIFLYYLKLFFKETSIHGLRYFVQDITLTEWYLRGNFFGTLENFVIISKLFF